MDVVVTDGLLRPAYRMRQFRKFEEEVLHLLAAPCLGSNIVESVIREAEWVNFDYSNSGYFLTVRHRDLPENRLVLAEPVVAGTCNKVHCGFIIFVEDHELMLECHTWGHVHIPKGFRDHRVKVKAL